MPLQQTTLARLKHQHESIAFLLSDIDPDELRTVIVPGKWSIHEQIAHLACYQPKFWARIERILSENEPEFERYRAENDPVWPEWVGKSSDGLFRELDSMRKTIVERLESLSDEQLERVGVHKLYGRLSIPLWTEFFLLHEAHHVYAIFDLSRRRENVVCGM